MLIMLNSKLHKVFTFCVFLCGLVLFSFMRNVKVTTSSMNMTLPSCEEPYCEKTRTKEFYIHNFTETNYSGFDVAKVNLKFLPNFKSPCIAEKIELLESNVYSNNRFLSTNYARYNVIGSRLDNFMYTNPEGVKMNFVVNRTDHGWVRIRCLPYFMLLGVAKSGTSDFWHRSIGFSRILPPFYKEVYFWSQFRFQLKATLGDYMDLFDEAVKKMIEKPKLTGMSKHEYRHMLSEYTAVEFTDNVYWREHPLNYGLDEPRYLNAHDIYAVNPTVKLIVLLRNPTDRLYSSYHMFNWKSPEDFHSRVVASIEWWRKCTEVLKLPVRKCVYGCPSEMPPLVCVLTWKEENNRWPGDRNHPSGCIRRGMYSVFAKDWLKIFPRNQILFLKTEENKNKRLHTFNDVVFPFLGESIKIRGGLMAKQIGTKLKVNYSNYTRMLEKTRILLDEFYKPFNEELANLLGNEKWLWKR